MHRSQFTARARAGIALGTLVGLVAAAALAASASADRTYHSQHLDLRPVSNAPLRSGFVENIKAQGPKVYAHELTVLNGASPSTTYTVIRNFFVFQPDCSGDALLEEVAELRTNGAGNGRSDVFIRPEEVAGFEGLHGVYFSIADATGSVLYRTACSAVTLD